MVKPAWLKNKILIIGLAREGLATLQFIHKEWPEIEIALADQRSWEAFTPEDQQILSTIQPEKRFLGPDYLQHLAGYPMIIKTPGENRRKPELRAAVENGAVITSATNLFLYLKKGKVVAVTGSKGKSTTASMIYSVLKAAGLDTELIGNIGRPALQYLEDDHEGKIYVFEISSYQLEDYHGGIDVGVMVSFFPEHLDYHGGVDEYFQAKMRMILGRNSLLKLVYNANNAKLRIYIQNLPAAEDLQLLPFNDGVRSFVDGDKVVFDGKRVLEEDQLKLIGHHNLENILAVLETVKVLGVAVETAAQALRDFVPLEHRLELLGDFKGITFFNDSFSTAPEATIAAISAVNRKRHLATLITGGFDRGYDYAEMAAKIVEAKIEHLILFPVTGEKIERELMKLKSAGTSAGSASTTAASPDSAANFPTIDHASTMEDAVEKAYRLTPSGQTCLLSCASPSFNLFKNFVERGEKFRATVKSLASTAT